MASALEKILKGTLQKSDAQKTFSPWWEDLQDKLRYGVMIMGELSKRIETFSGIYDNPQI